MPLNRGAVKPGDGGYIMSSKTYCYNCERDQGTVAKLQEHNDQRHFYCKRGCIGGSCMRNHYNLAAHYRMKEHWDRRGGHPVEVPETPETNERASDSQNASSQYGSSSAQRESEASAVGKTVECRFCNNDFSDQYYLDNHIKFAHPDQLRGSTSN